MPWHLKERYTSYTEPWGPVRYGIWALSKSALSALSNAQYRALLSPTSLLNSAFHLWFHTLNSHFIRFETERTTIPVLVPQCTGVVLELGPGTGNQLCRFDRSKIQRIVGVESNPLFVPDVEEQVRLCGLEGVYDLVVAGVEDGAALERAGLVAGSVDTVLSVQVLCSVDEPERVARELYELLKPGGKLIFWEHHRSSDWWTRAAQYFWNPMWRPLVGGCNVTRDMGKIVAAAGEWENLESIEGDEKPWSFLPRVWGVLVKPKKSK